MKTFASLKVQAFNIGKPGAAPPAAAPSSVDTMLRDVIRAIELRYTVGTPFLHDPRLVEIQLADISALLDRCIAYQLQISEYEIAAVQAMLEDQLATDLSSIELKIGRLRLPLSTAPLMEKGGQEARDAFVNAKDELASGFAKHAATAADCASATLKSAADLEAALQDRHDRLAEHRRTMALRFSEEGSAHNFEQRRTRTADLLREDFTEAYEKAKSVEWGLQAIFDVAAAEARLPDLLNAPEGPLYSLLAWSRGAMRRLDLIAESETLFDIVIPFVQPVNAATKSLIDSALYMPSMKVGGNGQVILPLADFFPRYLKRLRVLGVGLSVMSTADDLLVRSRRFYGLVFPPDQKRPGGQSVSVPGILLGDISTAATNQPTAFVEGSPVQNIDPRGEWRVLIHSNVVAAQTAAFGRAEGQVPDLRLHLRLAANTGDYKEVKAVL